MDPFGKVLAKLIYPLGITSLVKIATQLNLHGLNKLKQLIGLIRRDWDENAAAFVPKPLTKFLIRTKVELIRKCLLNP
jgi:hypothetical protein